MKLSLKLREGDDPFTLQTPLLRAKVPISVFNQPFVSTVSVTPAAVPSDLAFSIATALPEGPSIRVSYAPGGGGGFPFLLRLKTGLGPSGSPRHSPLVFSVHFSLSRLGSAVVPVFALRLKPRLGHFSLKRTTSSEQGSKRDSAPSSGLQSGGEFGNWFSPENPVASKFKYNSKFASASDSDFHGGFAGEASSSWEELRLEPSGGKDTPTFYGSGGVSSDTGVGRVEERRLARSSNGKGEFSPCGVAVIAKTVLPVTKRVAVNLRWGLNFLPAAGMKMPCLRVNKVCIEMIAQMKEANKSGKDDVTDEGLLKGICFCMRRDMENLEKENREMKQSLEEMRLGILARNTQGQRDATGKNAMPSLVENSNELEWWRSKPTVGEENSPRELKKSVNRSADIESELQRAIKAAAC